MPWIDDLKRRARRLKAETFALYLAARHPGTPWYAKLLVAAIVAYAFSPIDLIPDFIPVLGYLDDLLLLPLGIALAVRLVPPAILAECRARAGESMANGKPVSRVAGAVVVAIWLALLALSVAWVGEIFSASGQGIAHRLCAHPSGLQKCNPPIISLLVWQKHHGDHGAVRLQHTHGVHT